MDNNNNYENYEQDNRNETAACFPITKQNSE